MAISELEKLQRERKKEITLINKYGKGLNKSSIYYIHNNYILAESLEDPMFQGVYKVSGFDFDLLYLDPKEWYFINGTELYKILKGKEVDVEITNGEVKIKSTEGKYSIKSTKELSTFKKICKKYKVDGEDSPYITRLEHILVESKDRSLPVVVEMTDEIGSRHSIRFIRKMIKTNYNLDNMLDAYATLKSVREQVYICNITFVKREGTASKPRGIKLQNIYGIVPLQD